ncbi:ADP-ribosylation factor GTPase-activating protein AGD12-like isoform X1 [Oryza brachyantha]|uniref:ADP-ribosylation factor GTPase-activating protein AGD12-like isoform X1 n=1 Tax=Oryza brachyantha TaxID=4533 RepID=UPI00077648AA|nr:ADP-ribosylation factor GTPase-activating protein AGD12-like isoform X1 [Oryza brachyantha]
MSTANRYQPIKSTKPVIAGKTRKLKDLMLKSDNRICADCSAPDPKWASANIGVFLCLKCGDVHRALGPDVSKVLSVTLDDWSDSDIDSMVEVGGNSYANSIYEAFLPKDHPKPKPDSTMEYRTKFIRAKYETQDFLKPSLRITSKGSFEPTNSVKSVNSGFSSTSTKHVTEDTREFVGELNITVVRGIELAVRDMLTSDPYVILTLGEQTAQTTVKKSDLNPVWNEVLKLSVPRNYGPLKLQVYDHDMFSADDIMGEAEIDLQPMITAAMAFGDPSRIGDMQIGRWFMTRDNCLLKDSTVNVVSGKVKQEVNLKLQNVESGEMELELEWVPIL